MTGADGCNIPELTATQLNLVALSGVRPTAPLNAKIITVLPDAAPWTALSDGLCLLALLSG